MACLRKLDPRSGLDRVVEMHHDSMMRVVGPEGLGLGPIRIEDRKDVSDCARAVVAELVEAADGEM